MLRYTLQRIRRMDWGAMRRVAQQEAESRRVSTGRILADMAWCGLRYGAGYQDYSLFGFYTLRGAQRLTYITRGINNQLIRQLNNREDYPLLADKRRFNRLFSDLLGREWQDFSAGPQQFAHWCAGRRRIVCKPAGGECGRGVQVLQLADFDSPEQLFTAAVSQGADLAEEYIEQHAGLAALYPGAVNTYRTVTVLQHGRAQLFYGVLRIGNGGAVDNLNAGGMVAPVELHTGRVLAGGYDKQHRFFERHPITGVQITGTVLPFWEQAEQLCCRAAQRLPRLRYVGWDVAATAAGPVLVEGNHMPGYDVIQLPPHTPDKTGMLPRIRVLLHT